MFTRKPSYLVVANIDAVSNRKLKKINHLLALGYSCTATDATLKTLVLRKPVTV